MGDLDRLQTPASSINVMAVCRRFRIVTGFTPAALIAGFQTRLRSTSNRIGEPSGTVKIRP